VSKNAFRWRNSPAIIARYMHDREVTDGAEVTLKPNEACVVIEDGKIAGVASQRHMEVNPEAGILSKMFGRGNPKRSFLFAFLGPHELIIKVSAITKDGRTANGFVVLRAIFSRETVPRLLQIPAKGTMTITIGDLVSRIEAEVNATIAPRVRETLEVDLKDQGATEDLMMDIKMGTRGTMESLGLTLQSSFINWSVTEAEKVLQMRADLEVLAEKNAIVDEQTSMEMERSLQANLMQAEMQARASMASLAAEERAKAEMELARIRAQGDIDNERWEQVKALHQNRQNLRRTEEILDGDHQLALARIEAERQRVLQEPTFEAERTRKEAAMDMFDAVQQRKQERLAMEAERERVRVEAQAKGSEAIISTLTEIAQSSKDPEVAMEALRQLAEIRKADVAGAKDAYIDD